MVHVVRYKIYGTRGITKWNIMYKNVAPEVQRQGRYKNTVPELQRRDK
jgi:hypothetical protein